MGEYLQFHISEHLNLIVLRSYMKTRIPTDPTVPATERDGV